MDVSNKLFWSLNGSENNFISFSFTPQIFTKQLADYEWIETTVEIKSGCFNGKVKLSIILDDVFRFLKQIELMYRDLKGEAEFSTIEDQVFFSLNINKLGLVSIEGYVRDNFNNFNELKFAIESDQTFLFNCISDINNFIKILESSNSA